jgi:hypothetical protein
MVKIGDTVRPIWGRHAGHNGVVRNASNGETGRVYWVDFGQDIVQDGQTYPDAYWIYEEDLEVVK